MNTDDYNKAFMELRRFNMDRMGSGEWLQWYIDTCIASGRAEIVAPDDMYHMNYPLHVGHIPKSVSITILGTLIAQ